MLPATELIIKFLTELFLRKWHTIKVGVAICTNNECGIQNCKAKHHPLLYKPAAQVSHERNQVSENEFSVIPSGHVNAHSDVDEGEKPCFRIVPIRVYSKNKFINTFAFLDEGSDVTLMEREVFDSLGLAGVNKSLCFRWTGDTTRVEETSMQTSCKNSGQHNETKYILHGVHTVENISLLIQSLDMYRINQRYPYLAGPPIESYQNARPTILIKLDSWKLAVGLKVRESSWN